MGARCLAGRPNRRGSAIRGQRLEPWWGYDAEPHPRLGLAGWSRVADGHRPLAEPPTVVKARRRRGSPSGAARWCPATPPGEPVSDQLQSLREKLARYAAENRELARDLEEERKAQVEAASRRQDLAKAKEPSPPIPDEPLVILFRGYALPAHNSLWSTMERITRNCFNQGGWPGNFANLLKRHWLTDADLHLARVENAIAGTGDVPFEEEFYEFFFNYNEMLSFAYQVWKLERDWILSLREPWLAQDGDFRRQLEDLAKGIDRESLKRLTSGPQEERLLVRKALR